MLCIFDNAFYIYTWEVIKHLFPAGNYILQALWIYHYPRRMDGPPGPEIISRLENDEDVLPTSCGHTLLISWDNHIHGIYSNILVDHKL